MPQQKIITIDATGKVFGRLATEVATYLLGKHKASFEYHKDGGDAVVVKHLAHVTFTGKKYEQRVYQHHSGHPGGLKTTPLREEFAKRPATVFRRAVARMLPKNSHQTKRLQRLTVEV